MTLEWLQDELIQRRGEGLHRTAEVASHVDATTIEIDGQRLINFGANDYLGLATHPEVLGAAFESGEPKSLEPRHRWGSGASPLVSGYGPSHAKLERELAEFEGTEAAIVFSTGYAANVGTVTALASSGDVVFSDQLNHASLIDGCRLSRAKICVYPHGDVDLLRALIREHRRPAKRAFIVTDSLFSMDGDLAPLQSIVELAENFDLVPIVDEAHATGVYGRFGRGLCEALGLTDRVPVRIGTLSKAIGSLGGFVAGSHVLIDYLRNFARTYIYSTAMPAAMARAACAGLKLAHSMHEQRDALRRKSLQLRQAIVSHGLVTSTSDSPIIPVYLGSPELAVQQSSQLRKQGFFVPAIRPPTVPRDQSMLRISLSILHTENQIDRLIESLIALNRTN